MTPRAAVIATLIDKHETELLTAWLAALRAASTLSIGLVSQEELVEQTRSFLSELKAAVRSGADEINGPEWVRLKGELASISHGRALQGFSPTETASFVLSFKEPLFALLRRELGRDSGALAEQTWTATRLIDALGLYTTEVFQKSREEVIQRQGRELLELSTPVVQLWPKILAVPLIGTLDSERTQIVMERLLEAIVEEGAEIAIIDISGVPTVDTLVAQHLIKTVSAARLMGADCIISGIRPQIAQTIVHLGLDLNVVSKANMADAFALALKRTGQMVNPGAAGRRE
jgi:rsbT co-antagonist protein RsbR